MVHFTTVSHRHRTLRAVAVASSLTALAAALPSPAAAFGLGSMADVTKALDGQMQPVAKDSALPPAGDTGSPAASNPESVAAAPPALPAAAPTVVPAQAPVPPAVPAPAATAGADPVVAPTPDYYGERAKQVLAEERKGEVKLHALQLAAPEYDVLVCEAGCDAPGAHVLAKRLKSKSVALGDGAIKTAALAQGAECVGGCYPGDPAIGISHRVAPMMSGEAAGTWMTTVAPETAPPAPAGASSKGASKPAAKKAAAEDWMARINRERAAKAAPKS